VRNVEKDPFREFMVMTTLDELWKIEQKLRIQFNQVELAKRVQNVAEALKARELEIS